MTNCLLEICSCPYLISKIHKGNVGCCSYDEATVCRYQNIMDNREGIVYPSRNKQMPFFEPRVWIIRTCPLSMLHTCRTGITYERNLLFLKKMQHLFSFIEVGWGGGKRAGTYMRYSIEIIRNLSQDLRNCSYIWVYASAAIRHNAAAFSFRLNRLSNT